MRTDSIGQIQIAPCRRTSSVVAIVTYAALVCVALAPLSCIPRPAVPPGMVVVGARPLPTVVEGDRLFVAPVTEGGDTLLLSVETGNGTSMIYAAAAERMNLELVPLVSGADTAWLVDLPPLSPETDIPPLVEMPDVGTRFFVFPADADGEDGFLGQSWLAGRTWILDYPESRIWLIPPGALPEHTQGQVKLGFLTDVAGRRVLNVPRIRVNVGGDSIDLVLDTGASAVLTDSALAVLGGTSRLRGASFVTLSTLERWRREHPDWMVVENADARTEMPMIRVPSLEIGGQLAGAVWFIAAPDERFSARASRLTDRPVSGALGGNALRHFSVTLDYEHAIAIFERRP
ncbi:MAG TPA: hypothetical protein VKZ41_01320 [Gemmatimonadales bacterium]|nr:hypothetical protein [Gemmatimonadales bacterium]